MLERVVTQPSFADLLAGGDRRSIGQSPAVVATVLGEPERLSELLVLLAHADPLIRMRAADAAEKVTRTRPELLRPFTALVLRHLAAATQQEVRWHIAQMLPRLDLDADERREAVTRLSGYLVDASRVVRVCALQALADLSRDDEVLRLAIIGLLRDQLAADSSPTAQASQRTGLPGGQAG